MEISSCTTKTNVDHKEKSMTYLSRYLDQCNAISPTSSSPNLIKSRLATTLEQNNNMNPNGTIDNRSYYSIGENIPLLQQQF
jgi:hypothetical protein